MTRLVVVGQGYVGLPMALRAAQVGLDVVGLELNAQVVDALNAGRSHIDDISDEELQAGVDGSYRASTDAGSIAEADVVVVCVPTPLSPDGGPDLGAVESAARAIGTHVSPGTLCILESTTYPGTTEEVFAPLVSRAGELEVGTQIFVAFSPERIDPGNPTYGVQNTPKAVGGLTAECTRRSGEFYRMFIDEVVEAKGAREAEMAKLLENTFRHVNIALVNEMVRFSQELDIDLWDAIDVAATKPFGFMAFRPGPGVGGHCIPIDPSYLSHRVKAKLGYAFRMVELAEEINTAAPGYVAGRIWQLLNDGELAVKNAKILLLGVTYKADISDCRESPADPLAVKLLSWGADIRYHDPFIKQWAPHGTGRTFHTETDLDDALSSADVVVLLQAHAQYDLSRLASHGTPVLDTRGKVPAGEGVSKL